MALEYLSGQNLIPNNSFELAGKEPAYLIGDNNFTCLYWQSPSIGTPDYFTTKRVGNFSTIKNIWGSRSPFDGYAYAGIAINNGGRELFEYLQIKLSSKLIKGQLYCLVMYVSLGDDYKYSTDELDFIFTRDKIEELTPARMKIENYSSFKGKTGHFTRYQWNKIAACYQAKGEEEYLTFGMFNKHYQRINLTKRREEPLFNGMYLFVDNISLIQTSDTLMCKCNSLEVISEYDLAVDRPLILKNINFQLNESTLLEGSEIELKKLSEYLKKNDYLVEIIGYTDNTGTENDNLKLSLNRSVTVKDFLISNGVSKKRISCKGLGSKSPLKPNDSEENKYYNRRVEIKLIKKT